MGCQAEGYSVHHLFDAALSAGWTLVGYRLPGAQRVYLDDSERSMACSLEQSEGSWVCAGPVFLSHFSCALDCA